MLASRKILPFQQKYLPPNIFQVTMALNGTIKQFRGIQTNGICPVGVNVFSILSQSDGKKLAKAIKLLRTPDMEVDIKYTIPIYSAPKYIAATITRINNDVFVREKDMDAGEWEAFIESDLAVETPSERIENINHHPLATVSVQI